MDYKVSVNMSEISKQVFDGLEVPSSAITSFSAFRTIAQAMHKACLESKKKMESERKKMLETYSQSVVMEKLQEINTSYDNKVTSIKNMLKDKLNAIASAKEDAISAYTTTPPSDEQMRLLQVIQMKQSSISDAEWEMIVRKCADNYQALSIVKSIADKNGKTFVMPFTPDDDLEKLYLLKSRCEIAIDNIDKDTENSIAHEVLNYGPESNGLITELINDMDNSFPSATPLTLKEQLREASKKALHVGDYDTFNAISKFITDNFIALSEKNPSNELREASRILIDAGNNAKEPRKTYEAHRDELLEKYGNGKT